MNRMMLQLAVMFSLLASATLLYATPVKKNQRAIPSQYIIVFKDNVDTDKTAGKFLQIGRAHV